MSLPDTFRRMFGQASLEVEALYFLESFQIECLPAWVAEAGVVLEDMSPEEQVVGMVDSRVLGGRWVSLAERITELEQRKGPLSPGSRYNLDRIAGLAASFERKLGHPLAQLFSAGDLGLECLRTR
jgi:hypothetical protein